MFELERDGGTKTGCKRICEDRAYVDAAGAGVGGAQEDAERECEYELVARGRAQYKYVHDGFDRGRTVRVCGREDVEWKSRRAEAPPKRARRGRPRRSAGADRLGFVRLGDDDRVRVSEAEALGEAPHPVRIDPVHLCFRAARCRAVERRAFPSLEAADGGRGLTAYSYTEALRTFQW
ncbi:hypothetical protein C8F04DRAFT_1199900 [Mycena alexandri]|uniref:Uncharacterized protein n=1 Tax=Mycena alexandri TaxID=1745969 RepID=A0AAD6WNG6_9AGAR|nr:hypothetical protein C8F04DRAFT_1199900 [Mycena alexandri]